MSPDMSVFIAGVGVISAIGNNTAECLLSFENGKAGMDEMKYLPSVHSKELPVAEVKLSNEELGTLSGLSPALSRTALLSMIAAREALDNAAIENLGQFRTGFISANTLGGMDKT